MVMLAFPGHIPRGFFNSDEGFIILTSLLMSTLMKEKNTMRRGRKQKTPLPHWIVTSQRTENISTGMYWLLSMCILNVHSQIREKVRLIYKDVSTAGEIFFFFNTLREAFHRGEARIDHGF